MPFVTEERWRRRSWRVACLDLVEGRAEAVVQAWGVELRKRLLHQVQAHGSIDGGLRFDLDAYSRLEWVHSDSLAPFETQPGELAHLCEHGAHLTSLCLDRIPDACEWQHELEAPAGTVFAYQPALTAEERERGCIRPPAVVGSYAVSDGDGCKIGHIPRPVARDRDGLHPVWGTIRIRDGISTVSFDRAALLALRLPVTIYGLDTFGYTSVGGTGDSCAATYPWAWGVVSPASDGNATAMSLYVPSVGEVDYTLGLFNDNAGAPGTRIVDGGGGTSPDWGADQWCHDTLDAPTAVTAATPYWLCFHHTPWTLNFKYDAGSGSLYYGTSSTYNAGVVPNPATWYSDASSRDYSIYVTYTPTAAGALPMAMHHYRRRHS